MQNVAKNPRKATPMQPNTIPNRDMALGKASSPAPKTAFKMCIIVSEYLHIEAAVRLRRVTLPPTGQNADLHLGHGSEVPRALDNWLGKKYSLLTLQATQALSRHGFVGSYK